MLQVLIVAQARFHGAEYKFTLRNAAKPSPSLPLPYLIKISFFEKRKAHVVHKEVQMCRGTSVSVMDVLLNLVM